MQKKAGVPPRAQLSTEFESNSEPTSLVREFMHESLSGESVWGMAPTLMSWYFAGHVVDQRSLGSKFWIVNQHCSVITVRDSLQPHPGIAQRNGRLYTGPEVTTASKPAIPRLVCGKY